MAIDEFQAQVVDIASRASQMKKILLDPFRTDDGKFLRPTNSSEAKQRQVVLESAVSGTVYDTTSNGKMIAACHANALQGYETMYGRLPSDDLLASCHKAIENAILISTGKQKIGGVFESAEMSTTEGILMRDRLISLVLPVWLQSVTANMVTFIPGDFNQSEFYRIKRVAGSTFGNLTKGDIIDYDYTGQYSVMDRREILGTPNGTTTTFTFNSATKYGTPYPFHRKRARVYVDRNVVGSDNGEGVISGSYVVGTTTVVVSGTITYQTGIISVTFSVAPAAGVELHIGFDVDIEADPTLIPRLDHITQSRVMYPHESAITGNSTIQALWALRREIGQDIESLTMQGLRNLLAADKDRKHLHDMLFHCKENVNWSYTVPTALTMKEHYETLNAALLTIDSKLMNANGIAGLVGLVGGVNAVNAFRYLADPLFVAAPGFHSVPQPHYVGRLFGQWDLYCDPKMTSWECLCFAKGPDHGQTAYVAGDAVPALTFRHPVMGDLVNRATMWDLAYRDMQPFNGDKYLCKLTMIP